MHKFLIALSLLFLSGTSFASIYPNGLEQLSPDPPPFLTDSSTSFTQSGLVLRKVIKGNIRPKSIAHSGTGRFFAQNMMYQHSITVYDRNYNLIKTISDRIRLSDYDLTGYSGWHQGSPVECAFSPDGKYAYISNYKIYGNGFTNPGSEDCDSKEEYDHSYLYKVNTQSLEIEKLIAVGSVPKYLTVTPDGSKVLVSNWCSGDVSIVDTELGVEIERISLGKFPRGIVVDSKSRNAYICMMGQTNLVKLKLSDYSLSIIPDLGVTPRHICMSPDDRYLYITLSRPGKVIKYDLVKEEVVAEVETGKEARSMAMTPEGKYVYVVNYDDNSLSKVDAETFAVIEEIETGEKPVGVSFDPETRTVWVACYSGNIMVFEDLDYEKPLPEPIRDLSKVGPLAPHRQHRDRGISYVEKQNRETVPAPGERYIFRDDPVLPTQTNSPPPQTQETVHSRVQPPKAATRFYVIVANVQGQSSAQDKVKALRSKGYRPEILAGPGKSLRISCWSFDTKLAADRRLPYLRQSFPDAWIYQRKF